MTGSKIYYPGALAMLTAGFATTLSVACGSSFASSDCRETHTCVAAGGTDSAGSEAGAGSDKPPVGGELGATDGMPGGDGGAGGVPMEAKSECEKAADCDDGNRMNGLESCFNGKCVPGNAPPRVVSISPSNDAADVEPDGDIVTEFSEGLDAKTAVSANIQVVDGDELVAGTLAYADKKVTFTPAVPLALTAAYQVVITTGVTDLEGEPMSEAYSSKFAVRDGSWKTIDVTTDQVYAISDTLALTAAGNVLVAWSGIGESTCPIAARFFGRGAAIAPQATFANDASSCISFSASANARGDALVTWLADVPEFGINAARSSNGAWSKGEFVSQTAFHGELRAAVGPSGDASILQFSNDFDTIQGLSAWYQKAGGVWSTKRDPLATVKPRSPRPSVAFDAKGDGIAVWSQGFPAEPQTIFVSTYSSAAGKWSQGASLPGSTVAADVSAGPPQLAVAPSGEAMVVWSVGSEEQSKVQASYYSGQAWLKPKVISGNRHHFGSYGALPRVVHDGGRFVVAWEALAGNGTKPFTDVLFYDPKTGWTNPESRQTSGGSATAWGSTRLAYGGHGSVLVTWVTAENQFIQQWYRNSAWGLAAPIPDALVSNEAEFAQITAAANASGMAAVAWRSRRTDGIRLASYF